MPAFDAGASTIRRSGVCRLCGLAAVLLFVFAGNPGAEARKGAPPGEASAPCTFRLESGEMVRHPIGRFPLVMRLAPDLPDAIRDAAVEAMRRWNRGWAAYLANEDGGGPSGAGGTVSPPLFDWRSSETELAAANDGVNAIVLGTGAPAKRMASTPVSWYSPPPASPPPGNDYDTSAPIVDADIEIYLHERPRVNYRDGPPRKTEIDALSVLAHELGHVLGLGHATPEKDTVMTFPLREGARLLPTETDYDNLVCAYGPGLRHRDGDGRPAR